MNEEFRQMVFDFINRGFLENIVSLVKQEPDLIQLIPEMVQDERIRVRLGAVTLLEDLFEWKPGLVYQLIPSIGTLLDHENPTIRGDAASALEIILHPESLRLLKEHMNEPNPQVREVILEAIDTLEKAPLFSED